MLDGEFLTRLLDFALEGGVEILVGEAEQAESPCGTHEVRKRRDGDPEQERHEARGAPEERRDDDGDAEQQEEGDQRAAAVEPSVALHEGAQRRRQLAPLLQRETQLLGEGLRARGAMVGRLCEAAIDDQTPACAARRGRATRAAAAAR